MAKAFGNGSLKLDANIILPILWIRHTQPHGHDLIDRVLQPFPIGPTAVKRGITGSFHSVSKTHLHRYCDEFSFRWNERKTTDGERTYKAVSLIEGKRLMYKEPVRRRA